MSGGTDSVSPHESNHVIATLTEVTSILLDRVEQHEILEQETIVSAINDDRRKCNETAKRLKKHGGANNPAERKAAEREVDRIRQRRIRAEYNPERKSAEREAGRIRQRRIRAEYAAARIVEEHIHMENAEAVLDEVVMQKTVVPEAAKRRADRMRKICERKASEREIARRHAAVECDEACS